ncbi:MAG TPA: hypothetical protein VNK45_00535 [Candidatus Acidoferrales bacterium]|nr:hypothetical protein [Candidatus Acidoferrales bacterium]
MRKTIRILIAGLAITGAAPASFATQSMTDAELAALSGSGVMDPMMTMMANMMVVMSSLPVVGPLHTSMMSMMNRLPVLGPLHMRIMSHATLGGGHMDHTM